MTIADTIPKTKQTTQERGLPDDSFFRVTFIDGSQVTEREVNWSEMSEEETVDYLSFDRVVLLSKFPVKHIEAFHEGLQASLDVPEGARPYQCMRGETTIVPGHTRIDRMLGRCIGLVKDGVVVEEIFLDALQYRVSGMKL